MVEVLSDDESSNGGIPSLIRRDQAEDSVSSDDSSYMPLLVRRSDCVSSDKVDN